MDWKKKIAAVIFLLALVCVPVAAFLLPDQAVSKRRDGNLRKNRYLQWLLFGMERIWSS